MTLWKCGCGALNESTDKHCEACGLAAPTAALDLARSSRMSCPVDGAAMVAGICSRGGGAPMTEKCPFACPICRKPLEWSGACYQCHGTTSGKREDWEFPGDRYELEDGHWIKRADGPRRACSLTENQTGAKELLRVLGKSAMATPLPAAQADVVPF